MPTSNGFPRVVNNQPGVAVPGDFADANIRASVIAGAGALTALALRNPTVGNFAWADLRDPGTGTGGQAFSNYRGEPTAKIGFVHREQQGLITNFLAPTTQIIHAGREVTLMDQGSFWAKFAAGATVGQKVFAKYLDGSVVAQAAGTSTQTASITASLASTGVLTVTAVGSGALAVGAVLTDVAADFTPVQITAFLSGTGGTGTYQTTGVATVTSRTMVAAEMVETNFFIDSPASSNELAKISTWG